MGCNTYFVLLLLIIEGNVEILYKSDSAMTVEQTYYKSRKDYRKILKDNSHETVWTSGPCGVR